MVSLQATLKGLPRSSAMAQRGYSQVSALILMPTVVQPAAWASLTTSVMPFSTWRRLLKYMDSRVEVRMLGGFAGLMRIRGLEKLQSTQYSEGTAKSIESTA